MEDICGLNYITRISNKILEVTSLISFSGLLFENIKKKNGCVLQSVNLKESLCICSLFFGNLSRIPIVSFDFDRFKVAIVHQISSPFRCRESRSVSSSPDLLLLPISFLICRTPFEGLLFFVSGCFMLTTSLPGEQLGAP
ncbi:hypothetical protein L6452_04315 [Arctium lappa]|uniref:Uncharacterized protein n=1 Tax=Arctium lappa TaxID=4217 RepID=A0ACB9FQK2_ARCLA|nr:hypothetical protein L6452_04315 [Arctium lappa]